MGINPSSKCGVVGPPLRNAMIRVASVISNYYY